MNRKSKLIWGISIFCCIVLLICGALVIKKTRTLSGVYRTPSKADDGVSQPNYWYFEKNGKLLYCTPQVKAKSEKDGSWYGDASKGTWKPLGNNKFEIKMHDVYDNDSFTIKAKRKGNKFHTYANSKRALYEWDADTSTKQPSISSSEFMDMYNKAKISDQKNIRENGYEKPDNVPSSASSSSDSSISSSDSDNSQMSFDTAAKILQKGNFSDFDYERDSQTHDGSHATKNGGYVMITYPGAKGEDRYTITKIGKNKYHVEAEYGSSDGGFTKSSDQSEYGPTSADVTL